MLWPWYIFSIRTRPDLSSHVTKSYIFSSCNRSYSYALIIIWNLLSCETRTKREKKTKTKNGFLQDVGCSERCGVWSSASYKQQQLGKYNHFSQDPALYMKVFTVAVVVMSLRAFYDCTLIVEALFYTESYFRIQYVLLYIKCIVWRKLNKCCLKTNVFFQCGFTELLHTIYW